jgi:hypothetical protein
MSVPLTFFAKKKPNSLSLAVWDNGAYMIAEIARLQIVHTPLTLIMMSW